jgi:N-acetyl-anhydromuramyl-L-alanine amidase AmpD
MGSYTPAASDCIKTRDSRYKIDRIIIHTMEGSFHGTVAWFQTAGRPVPTAAHFCISKTGEVVQMVLLKDKCLHAGSKTQPGWNDRSIGIEHEDFAHDKTAPPEAMLKESADLVAYLCKHYGIPADRQHIIGHSEVPGVTHTDPGELWPWDHYMALVQEAYAKL